MPRYFFDIRNRFDVVTDEEGMDLPDLAAAEYEAAQSLADLLKAEGSSGEGHHIAIEVLDDEKRPIANLGLTLDSRFKR